MHDQAVKETSRRRPLVEASPVSSPGPNSASASASGSGSEPRSEEKEEAEPAVADHDTNQNPTGEDKDFKDPLSSASSS